MAKISSKEGRSSTGDPVWGGVPGGGGVGGGGVGGGDGGDGGGVGGGVVVPLSGAACTRQTQHRYVGLHPLGTCTRERRASWLGITRHMAGFNYQMELKINSSQCIYESKFAHR